MKSTNKLINYLESYTREKYFTERVEEIRKKIGIPEGGIMFPDNETANSIDFTQMYFEIKYKNVSYPTYAKKRVQIYSELLKPVPEIYQEHELIIFFNIFILYGKRYFEIFEQFYNVIKDSVSLIESRMIFLEREGCCDCETDVCENYMNTESAKYPVMIGISPYATQNEVLDLVKARWQYIQLHMAELAKNGNIAPFDEGKKQLSQIRERKTESKELEDTLYETRNLPLKVLVSILREKTGKVFDEGTAGKMRSVAVNRREKK